MGFSRVVEFIKLIICHMWDGEVDQNFDPKFWAYYIYILVWLTIFSYLQS